MNRSTICSIDWLLDQAGQTFDKGDGYETRLIKALAKAMVIRPGWSNLWQRRWL